MKLPEEITQKIVARKALPQVLKKSRLPEKKIVFTNGCFDLVHPGHIHLLHAARQLGDMLIVGLNSDESVRRLKGANRPVMDEHARAIVLASLAFVDTVVLFSEDTPLKLIMEINPGVLVKGGDYRPDEVVGSEYVGSQGGETVTIPFLEGYSSSALIDKTGLH